MDIRQLRVVTAEKRNKNEVSPAIEQAYCPDGLQATAQWGETQTESSGLCKYRWQIEASGDAKAETTWASQREISAEGPPLVPSECWPAHVNKGTTWLWAKKHQKGEETWGGRNNSCSQTQRRENLVIHGAFSRELIMTLPWCEKKLTPRSVLFWFQLTKTKVSL